MVFERYYIDLLDIINASCKKIASGNYEERDVERLFELSKSDRYPSLFTELAESIGMMMVKVESREFHLKKIIEELEKTKVKLQKYSKTLEKEVEKQNQKNTINPNDC